MIELKNITKKLDGQIVLDDISFQLEEGKIYGFIGRNGSGKSMLFRLICGLVSPTSGELLIDGKVISQKESFLGEAGALINKPHFLGQLTGIENLRLLASIQKKITDSDLEQVIDLVHLSEVKDKKYEKYSLGMKQKLGIAQAIMEQPRIIILDEPFSGLDKQSVLDIRKLIKELKQKERVILIASHIKEDIEVLCDEVYELELGKIIDHFSVS